MDDTISRHAAIDAADKIIERDTSGNNDVVKAMTAWKMYVEALPSAQPVAKDTNVPINDCISRQAAIDALDSIGSLDTDADREYAREVFMALPSAQPELLKIPIDHAPKADELERIKQAMRNTPVMLLPPAQPERCEDCVNFSKTRLMIPQPDIIRCRDCKYYDEVNQPYPQMYCRKHSIDTSDQDFCSRAERN